MVLFSLEVKRIAHSLPLPSSLERNLTAVKSFYGSIFLVIFFQKGGSLVFSSEVKRVARSLPLSSSIRRTLAAVKLFFGIFLW
jgi:hypothetical protein